MSNPPPALDVAPPPTRWFAPALTGCILACPGLWVAVSALGFTPHDALDATAVVAYWGAAGGSLLGVPTGALVAMLPENPALGVIAGMVAGIIAWGVGAAMAVGMLLGTA